MALNLLKVVALKRLGGKSALMTFDREVTDEEVTMVREFIQAIVNHAQAAINEAATEGKLN